MILLDQIPRNCYRGADSAIVFQLFDPMARDLAVQALTRGVLEQPEIRWHFARRIWFLTPLMHSERHEDHERALAEYQRLVQDVEELVTLGQMSEDAGKGDAGRERAARVVKGNAEAARAMAAQQLEYEKRHSVLIERFGRYPHRNKALGRETTAEERKFLEDGGDTFG